MEYGEDSRFPSNDNTIRADASNRQDNGSVTSSPEDRSVEFQISNIDLILERSSQRTLTDYELRYGFYEKDSELHKYVDQLAKKTLGANYSKVEIYIAKNTPHCEAFALPNGAIVISPEMIKVSKYEEALQALIAHEAFHIFDEHSKKNLIENIKDNKSTKSKLKTIGIKRASEHLSDLYQHLLATNNEDINPMGSVVLLENIDKYFQENRAGLTHGLTSDRALATEGVFYFYPFKNLCKELNEIPQEIINSIEGFNPYKRIDISGGLARKEVRQKYFEAKKEVIESTSDEDLPFFLTELVKSIGTNKKLSSLITEPLDRFLSNHFQDDAWEEDDPWVIAMDSALKLIAPNIYVEHNLKSNESLEEVFDWQNEEYDSLENFFKIEAVFNDDRFLEIFSKHKLSLSNILVFFRKTISDFIERQEDNLSDDELERIDKLVCSLARAGERFSLTSSTYPMQSEDIKEDLYYYLARKSNKKEVKKFFNKFISKINREKLSLDDLEEDSLAKKVCKFVSGEFNSLASDTKDVNTKQNEELILNSLNSISNYLSKEFKKLSNTEDIHTLYLQINAFALDTKSSNDFPHYYKSLFIIALVDAINNHNISEIEKNNLILNIFSDSDVTNHIHQDSTQEDDLNVIVKEIGFISEYAADKIKEILSNSIIGKIDEFLKKDLDRDELILTISPFSDEENLLRKALAFGSRQPYTSKILAKYLSRFDKIDELMAEIEILEERGLKVWNLITDTDDIDQFSFVAYPFFKELSTNGFNIENIEHYVKLANFIQDELIKKSFLNLINKKELEGKSYEERIDLIFDRIKRKLSGFQELKEITDDEICTHESFKKLRASFKQNISCLHDMDATDFGKLALSSLVTTGNIDASFKSAQNTIGRSANEKVRKIIMDEDPYIRDALIYEETVRLNGAITSRLNSVESKLFSINNHLKRGILLRILSGANGLISNKGTYRKKFLNFLLSDILNESEDNSLSNLLEDIVESSGEIETWKPLFFSLQNLLVDYTLKANTEVTEWVYLLESHYIEEYDEEDFEEIEEKSKLNSKERKDEKYTDLDSTLEDSNKLEWRNKFKFSEGIALRVLDFLENEGAIEERTEFIELEVLDLILEICQSAGALGVRFLQLFPLFTNLDPKYKDKFSKAFDKVDGQSRFVAIMTLDDNWENFWEDVEYIYPGKIGGGSINTVLKLKMKENAYHPEFSGKTITVKVRNPNLEFHLEETYNMLSEAINELIEINPKYKIAKLIIDDVYLWIKNELNYKNYVEKDKQFHKELEEFNETNDGVQLITPNTYQVPLKDGIKDTNLIIAEDFIESDHITDGFSKLREKGYEMKTVVSTMIRNYCYQLSKGFANSDISIGNYLLAKGEDDETLLAIIDKLYFLEIDDEIKDSLKPLTTLLNILGEDPKEYANKIRNNVNLDISDSKIEQIEEKLNSLKEDFSQNNFSIEKAKEVFTNIVKLIPELDQLISKIRTEDVILKDSRDFVSEVFRIFKQEIEDSDLDLLSKQLNDARALLITQARADGVLGFANMIVEKLELNQETKELMEMLIAMYAFSVKSSDEKVKTINELVTNKDFAVNPNTKDEVKSVLTEAKVKFENSEFGDAIEIFHKLREIGLKFDIRITLALKNIFALHQMAIDAGFSNGFFEGLCYKEE